VAKLGGTEKSFLYCLIPCGCECYIPRCIAYAALYTGIWGLGLATWSCNLHKVPLGVDANSWVLRHDGVLSHNGHEIGRLDDLPLEGDIIVSIIVS